MKLNRKTILIAFIVVAIYAAAVVYIILWVSENRIQPPTESDFIVFDETCRDRCFNGFRIEDKTLDDAIAFMKDQYAVDPYDIYENLLNLDSSITQTIAVYTTDLNETSFIAYDNSITKVEILGANRSANYIISQLGEPEFVLAGYELKGHVYSAYIEFHYPTLGYYFWTDFLFKPQEHDNAEICIEPDTIMNDLIIQNPESIYNELDLPPYTIYQNDEYTQEHIPQLELWDGYGCHTYQLGEQISFYSVQAYPR